MDKTCVQCKNFIGAGDWNLCCKNPPESAKDNWCGFLCYEDTPACENFESSEERLTENQEFIRELIQEQHSCG